MTETPDIIYTKVDESPELASASLLPIVRAFAAKAGINIETRDISLSGRVLAAVSDLLEGQDFPDHLAELGELVQQPEANIIKLPNISASMPQLLATIKELQDHGIAVPDYPADPATDAERDIRARYDAVKGSAVNPVLREGNSDRRAAKAVKAYARAHPHSMGTWTAESKTHVAAMPGNDFFANEKAATITAAQAGAARITFTAADGTETVLKDGLSYEEGTVVDATFLSAAALRDYIKKEIAATEPGVLFSVHLKATMMKVSDPILFGHFVSVYLDDFIARHGARLDELGWNPNNGLGSLEEKIAGDATLEADYKAAMAARPPLYMVDSDKGITNLHVPSDVIVDASMPAAIRAGGKGWGPDGKQADLKCCIPDNAYAVVYDETINFFKANGALDVTTAGAVSNVGLMAQKAEEYGSHPTTFEMTGPGTVRIVLASGEVLHEQAVETGDIWRSATANKAPILDWIKLGIARHKAVGLSAFWLDEDRAHDAEIIKYIRPALAEAGVDIPILAPREATAFTLAAQKEGKDVVTITGNVLRDYLTDLFPILELGTSAKMLSIVKLMNGGGMFETGAGGSAPKHVAQLIEQNHLRWDSLGEFCALGESFKFLAEAKGNAAANLFGDAIEVATQKVLENGHSPQYKPGSNDTRTSHFWFARYWAEALVNQTEDADLAAAFAPISEAIIANEDKIVAELLSTQGEAADIGGYYHTDPAKMAQVMRPSTTLNGIIG